MNPRKPTHVNYDELVHAVQCLPDIRIYAMGYRPDGSTQVLPWMDLKIQEMLAAVSWRISTAANEAEALPVQMLKWGTLLARQQRALETAERHKRVWKAKKVAEIANLPEDQRESHPLIWKKDAKDKWKDPAVSAIEQQLPSFQEYSDLDGLCSACKEACSAVELVMKALSAKAEMIKTWAHSPHGA